MTSTARHCAQSFDATDAELAEVLELVRLTELVATLPAGLDTPVGERGAQPSGGERQRMALARSILAGYPVIVVDEATSGVDERTAQQIYDGLDAGLPGTTLVVITHRLPRMPSGALVMTLAGGRIDAPVPATR